jgi:hypothetical protein
MAKGLNLVATNIVEFRMNRDFDDAHLQYTVEVLDDADNTVRYDTVEIKASDLPNNVLAAFNAFMRLASKDINNDTVEEDTETWIDI